MRGRRRRDIGVDVAVVDAAAAVAAVVLLVVVALGPLRAILVVLGAAVTAATVQLALVHLGVGMLLSTLSHFHSLSH